MTVKEAPLVALTVAWGSQSRNYCPRCQRFVSAGERVTCGGCSTLYVKEPGSSLYRAQPKGATS